MQKDSQFSVQKFREILASAEGKQLIAMLSRDGGKGMQQAAEAYRKGDVAGAQEALRPLVDTPEGNALLQKLQNGK